MREFGAALYDTVRRWPPALIYRAAEIERERDAGRRLTLLQDTALSTGLKLGQKYVDPKGSAERNPNEPYYSLQPLQDAQRDLERAAFPWLHTPVAVRERREAEEEHDFDHLFVTLGALNA